MKIKNTSEKKHFNILLCMICISAASMSGMVSCEEILPEEGSLRDKTPPKANFTYSVDPSNHLTIHFSDASTSATTYTWDFGNNKTSTEKNPSSTYDSVGTYQVTLVASDNLGVSNSITIEAKVVEAPFQPVILESSFEPNSTGSEACGTGVDGRDCWRNSGLGEVFQITSSPVNSGEKAAKLTGSATDQRTGYQLVTVVPQTNYDLNFYYTMKNDKVGFITVSVLSGPVSSHQDAMAATIGSITVNDQSDPSTYVAAKVAFNSDTSSQVAIYFFNEGSVESRLDDFSIDIGQEGTVPPSAAFSFQQTDTNYLAYTFTNNSVNATSYSWDFGDGTMSTEESPTYKYAEPNTYSVTLTATNGLGNSASFSAMVDIQAPVTASFTFEVDTNDYKTYVFMDSSEGAVSLSWDFGDGFQFTGMNPTHTYNEDGIYTVTLTATSSTGLTNEATENITVTQGFVVQVLNGTFDEYTHTTGDNADAWDMTPDSTVVDNNGTEIKSPYRDLWNNSALDSYIDTAYCSNEQPATTSDGNNGRGAKFSNSCRRLYQVVQVQMGVSYNFSIDTRSEVDGVNTEVFILNREIETETGINSNFEGDVAVDKYFNITGDFNTDKTVFKTSSFTFIPSTNSIVIYVRALGAVDSGNEVFLDNVKITEN